MAEEQHAGGLEKGYGEAPAAGRKATGDPTAPPAAATDTLGAAMTSEADARTAQADRVAEAESEGAPEEETEQRRKRAYAVWEREGRPDGRHEDHWRSAGGDEAPEPGTAPWTEGP